MGREGPGDAQDWPEWCVRQCVPGGQACVFVLAPHATAAVVIANRLVGPLGSWRVAPDADLKVFPRAEYGERSDPGEFTRMVIDRPVRQAWLDKTLPPHGRRPPPTPAR